jgi:putative MATE family efflux protein
LQKKRVTDLTQGSILKHLIMFSTPMLLGNILQALYNTVDSILVGKFVGPSALAAVAVSFPVIFMLVAMIIGFAMSTSTLVSQYAGAKDYVMVKKTIGNSIAFLGVAAIIMSLFGIAFSRRILELINTPDDIINVAADYLRIYLTGLIFVFGFNLINAILRGLGNSKTPLLFLLYSTVINIVLDFVLITGWGPFPQMGASGAALATVIAQGVAVLLGIIYLTKHGLFFNLRLRDIKFDKTLTRLTVKIGLPSGTQQTFVSIGMLVINSVINRFGTPVVSAFGAASRIDQYAFMPAMTIGAATAALSGQNIGARKFDRVKDIVKWSTMLAVTITSVISILIFIFPQVFISIFISSEGGANKEVIKNGIQYLKIVSLSYIPFSMMFISNGVLQGAGDTWPVLIISIVSLWGIRVPLANYLSATELGPRGIWIAMAISAVMSMILSRAYYYSGYWKKRIAIKARPGVVEDSPETLDTPITPETPDFEQ